MTKAAKAKKMTRDSKQLRTELKPRAGGQTDYLRTLIESDVTFATGPAGTGKSFLCIGLACQYILEGRYDYIVIARPTVEASPRGLGFLPGDMEEKLSPYLYPAVEHMKRFLGPTEYAGMFRDGIIKFEALEYMRGRTYDNTFMILEEAQNCTADQLKMFVTRIGDKSKIAINGDIEQSDVGSGQGLHYVMDKLAKANLPQFGLVELTESDIVRNKLIGDFLRVFK